MLRDNPIEGYLIKVFQESKVNVYPTVQSVTQVQARKAAEAEMVAQGMTKEEIMKVRKSKKKTFVQEQHFDDCGSDTGLLEEGDYLCSSCCNRDNEDDMMEYCFFDLLNTGKMNDEIPLDTELICDDGLETFYFNVSDVDDSLVDGMSESTTALGAYHVTIDKLDAFLSQPQTAGMVDVMELFGGAS